MKDALLQGFLHIMPEDWGDTDEDKLKRYQVYLQASRKIADLNRALMALVAGHSDWPMSVSDKEEELITKMLREEIEYRQQS